MYPCKRHPCMRSQRSIQRSAHAYRHPKYPFSKSCQLPRCMVVAAARMKPGLGKSSFRKRVTLKGAASLAMRLRNSGGQVPTRGGQRQRKRPAAEYHRSVGGQHWSNRRPSTHNDWAANTDAKIWRPITHQERPTPEHESDIDSTTTPNWPKFSLAIAVGVGRRKVQLWYCPTRLCVSPFSRRQGKGETTAIVKGVRIAMGQGCPSQLVRSQRDHS